MIIDYVNVKYLDITGMVLEEDMPKNYYEDFFSKRPPIFPFGFRHGFPKVTEFKISKEKCECCNQITTKRIK
jgi:hypothetical protein